MEAAGGHGHKLGPWTREQLARLEYPGRDLMMPRALVLDYVGAPFGSRVADVGAGLGWLTFPLALVVGSLGEVFALDPSPEAVEVIGERAQRSGLAQVRPREASAEETGLPDNFLDRIVWHTMYHDVADRAQALGEMHRILKPQGRWIIVDWDKRPMEKGPPLSVRVTPQEVETEVEAVGFRVVRKWSAGPVTWGITLEKP